MRLIKCKAKPCGVDYEIFVLHNEFCRGFGFMWCYIMVLLAGSPAARPEHKRFVSGMAKIVPVKRQKIDFLLPHRCFFVRLDKITIHFKIVETPSSLRAGDIRDHPPSLKLRGTSVTYDTKRTEF